MNYDERVETMAHALLNTHDRYEVQGKPRGYRDRARDLVEEYDRLLSSERASTPMARAVTFMRRFVHAGVR